MKVLAMFFSLVTWFESFSPIQTCNEKVVRVFNKETVTTSLLRWSELLKWLFRAWSTLLLLVSLRWLFLIFFPTFFLAGEESRKSKSNDNRTDARVFHFRFLLCNNLENIQLTWTKQKRMTLGVKLSLLLGDLRAYLGSPPKGNFC